MCVLAIIIKESHDLLYFDIVSYPFHTYMMRGTCVVQYCEVVHEHKYVFNCTLDIICTVLRLDCPFVH
jgi:hypothetical protein